VPRLGDASQASNAATHRRRVFRSWRDTTKRSDHDDRALHPDRRLQPAGLHPLRRATR